MLVEPILIPNDFIVPLYFPDISDLKIQLLFCILSIEAKWFNTAFDHHLI